MGAIISIQPERRRNSPRVLTRQSVRGHGPWYIDCTCRAGYGNNNENSVLVKSFLNQEKKYSEVRVRRK